ncbi:hypothetical protein KR50_29030 [Jeotgalibacillus campisalis]|uniref:Uncharacterized protein n=1 Tax=Jeotgalibacillus campisalis TaxID=220754 RepID=A0A0C2RWT3_9BACL|nr:hypothetical protein KR50_29030 [Jeotgalibacillus campisalis]
MDNKAVTKSHFHLLYAKSTTFFLHFSITKNRPQAVIPGPA